MVVSTNQSQYPTAKAVSLSVANLPQQTTAIPLIIGQPQQQQQLATGLGSSSVTINASTKYGTTTVMGHTTVLGPGGSGGGMLGVAAAAAGQTNNHHGPTISGGITRIVDSAGNILHLPSGTAAAAVNSGSVGGGGVAGAQYSTLMRVKGNGSVMENVTGE